MSQLVHNTFWSSKFVYGNSACKLYGSVIECQGEEILRSEKEDLNRRQEKI